MQRYRAERVYEACIVRNTQEHDIQKNLVGCFLRDACKKSASHCGICLAYLLIVSQRHLRLEIENDLGGLALLAPVHIIYLPRVDGNAVNVLTVRAQLETTPQRAATDAMSGAIREPGNLDLFVYLFTFILLFI